MDWAREMAKNGRLSHGDSESRIEAIYQDVAVGENIAVGRDVEQVIRMWMGSPRHRANILGRYSRVGVGFAKSNTGMMYWCADFANIL
jgi:uncharacterized protein YkwD